MCRLNLFLVLLCCYCQISFGAAQNVSYDLKFSREDFNIRRIKGDTSVITSSKFKLFSAYQKTMPELPKFYFKVLLPPNSKVNDFTITKTESLYANDIILNNCRIPSRTGIQDVKDNGAIWYMTKKYDSSIQFKSNMSLDCYQIATFEVSPFSYDATSKKLYISDFTIKVTLGTQEKNTLTEYSPKNDKSDRAFIKENVFNAGDLDRLYPEQLVKSHIPNDDLYSYCKDYYLIITTNSLKDAFLPLLQWKNEKGLGTEIITIEEIKSQILGNYPDIYKIKKYIFTKYQNIKNTISDFYLLLGGDAELIPTPHCLAPRLTSDNNNISNSDYHYDEYIPCDLFYTIMNDSFLGWTYRNDTILNETPNSVYNEFSKIYIGRLPAKNTQQVTAMVNKILNYEKNPPADWGDKVLFCGERIRKEIQLDSLIASHTVSDTDYMYHNIVNDHMSHWNGTIDYLFDTYTNLYTEQDNITGNIFFSLNRFVEQFKKNYSFVCEVTHGEDTMWLMTSNENMQENFTSSMADTIQSNYPKIVISAACFTNKFDQNESVGGASVGEALMRNPSSGVIACLGNTREGFTDDNHDSIVPDESKRSNGINKYFIKALYDDTDDIDFNGHLGKIVDYARRSILLDAYGSWVALSLNLFGDPETQAFTTIPHYFDNALCYAYDDNIYICSGVDSTEIQDTYSDSDSGDFRLQQHANDTITAMIFDSASVVFKKQNYIPIKLKAYNRSFIQNFVNNQDSIQVLAYKYVDIGYNVTPLKPQGPVIIQSGTLSCNASEMIHVGPGVTCRILGGLKLNIYKNPVDN